VRSIVPTVGKISIADKTGSRRPREVSEGKSSMATVGLVNECEPERVGRPSEERLTRRSRVAWIFMRKRQRKHTVAG
jgi:hypothetical protein